MSAISKNKIFILIGIILLIVSITFLIKYQKRQETNPLLLNENNSNINKATESKINEPSKDSYLIIKGSFSYKGSSKTISSLYKILGEEKDYLKLLVVDDLNVVVPWSGKARAEFFFSPTHLFKYRRAAKTDLIKATKNQIPLIDLFDPKEYRLHESENNAKIKIDRIEP